MSNEEERTDVVTPVCRLSFPNLFEARAPNENATPKFSASLLFDEAAQGTEQFKRMRQMVEAAIVQKWGNNPPRKLRRPFLTIDDLNNVPDGYEDEHVIVRCNTTIQPGVVDQHRQEIIDPSTIYPGCYVRAALHAFAWSHKTGGNGVSFGLDHIQFVKDGQPFSKRSKPTDIFDSLPQGDDFGSEESKAKGDPLD
jgi:hypothetical protein